MHLTEYARDRTRNNRDSSFQHFADIFHHRALSLFYRAWANSRPTVSFDRPEDDRFALYVGALMGLGMDSLRDRDAMPDLTKLHFAGHFACQTRHAEGLSSILSAFFDVPVRVECFLGAWLVMPEADRTRLGASPRTAALGRTALLGGRVWSRQHKFRIVMGPLDLADYRRLLPGGRSFHRLIPIVRNYVGDTLIWDVNLILRREQVPPIRLGRTGELGWTTWLMPRNATADAADLFLDASADSMASRIHSGASSPASLPQVSSRPPLPAPLFPGHQPSSGQYGASFMTEISRTAAFGKLNPIAYKAIEGATVFCKLRGNPYVELVHWLHQILQVQDSDLHRIVRHYELDASQARRRLHRDARQAAARRHLDLRPVAAYRGGGRARLGVRHADVRRSRRCAPATCCSAA